MRVVELQANCGELDGHTCCAAVQEAENLTGLVEGSAVCSELFGGLQVSGHMTMHAMSALHELAGKSAAEAGGACLSVSGASGEASLDDCANHVDKPCQLALQRLQPLAMMSAA